MDIVYNAEPTPAKFHKSDAFYRGILGPVGSSKSTACCWELWRRANEQRKGPDGLRHTRFAVVRSTYRELLDSSMRTWVDWFPEEQLGPLNKQDMIHKIRYGEVESEVLFRALDRPDDVKKLLSVEYTGAWVNEFRESPKSIIDVIGDRVERYPAVKDGGCTWAGVIMDSNMPDDDHWVFDLVENNTPEGWEFFKQPGGLIERDGQFSPNPDAENLKNLPEDYYVKRMAGKGLDYIRVYYCAQYGFVKEGKPVHPEYVDSTHCLNEDVFPVPGIPIVVGVDFGLMPAATFMQRQPTGQWIVFDEIVTEQIGIKRFAELLLKPRLDGIYQSFDFEIWGDPAGNSRAQTDEATCFQILDTLGIRARPAPYQDSTIRREALSAPLSRLIDGKPGLVICPKCKILRKALAGGYCFKRVQVSGDERYHDKPDKNKFSHISESCEYGLVGAGEGKTLIHRPYKSKPINLQPGKPGGWMG